MRRFSNAPPDWAFPDRDVDEQMGESEELSLAPVTIAVDPTNGDGPRGDGDGPRFAFRCLADVAAEPLEWVLDDVIPRGALTLITGDSGVGKSRLAVGLIAAVLRGQGGPRADASDRSDVGSKSLAEEAARSPEAGSLPAAANLGALCDGDCGPDGDWECGGDRSSSSAAAPAVVVFSSKQMLTDSIRPRLVEAGADLTRVFTLCGIDDVALDASEPVQPDIAATASAVRHSEFRPWSIQWDRDIRHLEAELRGLQGQGVNVRMIVIDPVESYFDSALNRSFVDADVTQLAELATRTGVAIIGASSSFHAPLRRLTRRRRSGGIEAVASAARMVWMIVRDLDVANRRMLLPIKKCQSIDPAGYSYSLRSGVIEWDPEPVTITGDDYVSEARVQAQKPLAREHQFEKDRAAEWLYERLSAGRVLSSIVKEDAAENEIAYTTLRRAFRSLGCKTNKERGKGRSGQWYWRLPGEGFFYRAGAPRLVGQRDQDAGMGQLFQNPEKQGFE